MRNHTSFFTIIIFMNLSALIYFLPFKLCLHIVNLLCAAKACTIGLGVESVAQSLGTHSGPSICVSEKALISHPSQHFCNPSSYGPLRAFSTLEFSHPILQLCSLQLLKPNLFRHLLHHWIQLTRNGKSSCHRDEVQISKSWEANK